MKGPFAVGDKVHVEFTVIGFSPNSGLLDLSRPDNCNPALLKRSVMGRSELSEDYPTIVKHIPAPLPPHKAGDTFNVNGDVRMMRTIVFIDNVACMYKDSHNCRYLALKVQARYTSIRWPT